MNFLTAWYTDVGIRKKTNQDSMLILQANTEAGKVLFAAVCDGMGGLAKGEVASAGMVRLLDEWFRNELPGLLAGGLQPEQLQAGWEGVVMRTNQRIGEYTLRTHAEMGTTCVCLLIVGNTYYIMNIGDSRIYLLADNVYQLTKDQTYVQREVDAGRMTYEQSLVDSQRSVLLQCVGASVTIVPDFFIGTVTPDQCYMLCCDGFRHVIDPSEFYQYLGPNASTSREGMTENLRTLTELNKQRNETDNISAILIRTYA